MFFVQLFHAAQVALSAYGLQVSYVAITNLQQYEERTKKAAKYSNEAGRRLHKTRTTQASGALAVHPPPSTSRKQDRIANRNRYSYPSAQLFS
jgi:hypothetical protein